MSLILDWLPVITIIALVFNGFRLRSKLSWLPILDDEYSTANYSYQFITAKNIELSDETRSAAADWADQRGLSVIDLIPRNLPVRQALDLTRSGLQKDFLTKRLAKASGAGHALLVTPDIIEREGLTQLSELSPADTASLLPKLKRLANVSTDFVVAPGLAALPSNVQNRAKLLRQKVLSALHLLVLPLITYAALIVGLVAQPILGLCAVLLFCLQPYVVFSGSPIVPGDLHRTVLLRWALDPINLVQTAFALRREPRINPVSEESRAQYAAELAQGTEQFFEPRRETCPWCGSTALKMHIRCFDSVQNKPGKFFLERCTDCNHIFQNPRLSLTGLDFYYRDSYDGYGSEVTAATFESSTKVYYDRAQMVSPFIEPKTWLDVGTGHGHFCTMARDVLPQTAFDGLDMGSSIEEAARRDWVDRGYRGQFPELTDELIGRYDVISMHHYLEHTREPFAELDAAAKVLSSGGLLLIEVPNPQSRYGRLLRSFWIPWFPPQHQHMIPLDNLVKALADRGLETISTHRGQANIAVDITVATALALHKLGRDPRLPWRSERPTWWRLARYHTVMTLGVPFIVLAALVDRLANVAIKRGKGGNAYRVLARKVG